MNAPTQHGSNQHSSHHYGSAVVRGPRLLAAAAASSLALMLLPAVASAATTAGTAPSVAKTGSISGRITGNGHPLAGQCVEAYNIAAKKVAFGSSARNGKY